MIINYKKFIKLISIFILIEFDFVYSVDEKENSLNHGSAFYDEEEIEEASSMEELDTSSDSDESSLENQKEQLINTLDSAGDLLNLFELLFNPPESFEEAKTKQPIGEKVLNSVNFFQNFPSNFLFPFISGFINSSTSTNPIALTQDYQTLLSLMMGVGAYERPEYFQTDNAEITNHTLFSIGLKFLRELVETDTLDKWGEIFKQKIAQSEANPTQKKAIEEFIEVIIQFLKYACSEDVNNPGKDPLNKYVDIQDIKEAISLKEWLNNNQGKNHKEFIRKQLQYDALDKEIKDKRYQALKEGSEYFFNLLKTLDPELSHIKQDNLSSYIMQKGKRDAKRKFETYIKQLSETGINRFPSLKDFWEEIYRQQYGPAFYSTLCESFNTEYKESKVHQFTQNMWVLSQLDTINVSSQEARSRMPGTSIDGAPAPNFGYRMSDSHAYAHWLKNDLTRACGNIIVDSFHSALEVGKNLDIETFMQRFELHLIGTQESRIQMARNPHPYDNLLINFELFLLEHVFQKPFISNGVRTITKYLKESALNSSENLIALAKKQLTSFKKFCQELPNFHDTSKSFETGKVFGIGFNGKIFNSPNFSYTDENEIWITFSKGWRHNDGYFLLYFLKYFADYSPENLKEQGNTILKQFPFYKPLIREELHGLENFWIGDEEYVKNERTKYQRFLSELKTNPTFDSLSNNFKNWLQKISNWYKIPGDIKLKIANEVPTEDENPHFFARELLLDALTQRSFTENHEDLIPFLFKHWKGRLLQLDINNSKNKLIKEAASLDSFSEEDKEDVVTQLNKLIWDVHPDIKAIWDKEIQKKFDKFIESKKKSLKVELDHNERSLKGIGQKLNNTKLSQDEKDDFESQKQKLFKETENIKKRLDALSSITLKALKIEEYNEFKEFFFKQRDTTQCIEPVFARVLGHDHFFSVFISRQPPKHPIKDPSNPNCSLQLGNLIPFDVINPCDNKCQHHVLGHVYLGDILSYQSADKLDEIRKTQGFPGLTPKLIPFSNFWLSKEESIEQEKNQAMEKK